MKVINYAGTTEQLITLTSVDNNRALYILYINPDESGLFEGVDITSMVDYKYDETIDIIMPVVVNDVNNWLPLDYRTKEQIINDINETKKSDLT